MNVALHHTPHEGPIGAAVVSTISFIQRVLARDIALQLSVRVFFTCRNVDNDHDISLVTGVGDPHISTVDNARFTCHIQGSYVFARTTESARLLAANNNNNSLFDVDAIFPDDLFSISVYSFFVAPALPYIARTRGYGSIFSSYTITISNFTFVVTNNGGRFSKFEARRAELGRMIPDDCLQTSARTATQVLRLCYRTIWISTM